MYLRAVSFIISVIILWSNIVYAGSFETGINYDDIFKDNEKDRIDKLNREKFLILRSEGGYVRSNPFFVCDKPEDYARIMYYTLYNIGSPPSEGACFIPEYGEYAKIIECIEPENKVCRFRFGKVNYLFNKTGWTMIDQFQTNKPLNFTK